MSLAICQQDLRGRRSAILPRVDVAADCGAVQAINIAGLGLHSTDECAAGVPDRQPATDAIRICAVDPSQTHALHTRTDTDKQ